MGFLFFFLICVGTAYWVSWTKNSLVEMQKRADAATAEIAAQAKQRVDLVPNLVETAKGYAEQEQETFEAAEAARNAALAATKPAEVAAAETALAGAIGKLVALGDVLSRAQGQRRLSGSGGCAGRDRQEDRGRQEGRQRSYRRIQRGASKVPGDGVAELRIYEAQASLRPTA